MNLYHKKREALNKAKSALVGFEMEVRAIGRGRDSEILVKMDARDGEKLLETLVERMETARNVVEEDE
jgi:hypothetical protein